MPFDSKSASKSGRKSSRKGVPNKATTEVRTFISNFLEDDQSKSVTDWDKLSAWERWQIRTRLMEFVIPKLARSETTIDVSRLSDEEVERLLNIAISKAENDE